LGKSQRAKGCRGELYARDLLRQVYPKAYRSGDQWRDVRHCDVEGCPYWVEAKFGARPNVWAALAQAERDTDGRPILIYLRRDRTTPLIALPAADWIRYEAERILGRMFG
jgi:hypothetical protein